MVLCFLKNEVPADIPGLTGGAKGFPVDMSEFKALCSIPIIMYFGDYIPTKPSKNLGDENWRVRLAMAKEFAKCINKHGGNCTIVELPKIGIYGNTHFLMEEKNNAQLADLLDKWLEENKLK